MYIQPYNLYMLKESRPLHQTQEHQHFHGQTDFSVTEIQKVTIMSAEYVIDKDQDLKKYRVYQRKRFLHCSSMFRGFQDFTVRWFQRGVMKKLFLGVS